MEAAKSEGGDADDALNIQESGSLERAYLSESFVSGRGLKRRWREIERERESMESCHPTSGDGGFLVHRDGDCSGGDHNPARCGRKHTLSNNLQHFVNTCTVDSCLWTTHTHTHMREKKHAAELERRAERMLSL